MPVEKVKDPNTGRQKFRWGKTGKLYTRRIDAVKQGEAIQAKRSSTGMSTGGTVNAAGNYTKPTMRKNLVSTVKAGSKGGKPGQWSARKAQMVAKQYKAKGGGYKS
jgi:hypothetical protein